MRCTVSSSSVEQCALCASSTHDVHHAIVGVNVVIGVLVVHCELLVVRVVPLVVGDDAVAVRRTLVLIAVAEAFVFFVAIFHIDFPVLAVYCLHSYQRRLSFLFDSGSLLLSQQLRSGL